MKTLLLALLLCVPVFAQYNQNNFNGGGSTTASANAGVNAVSYGAVGEGHVAWDVATTNTSNIVTSATANFTVNATVGQPVWVTTLTSNGFIANSFLVTPTNCTISSVDSATQIHMSCNATATQVAGTASLWWGTDETTQLGNAKTAAINACSTLNLPGVNPEGTGPAMVLISSSAALPPAGNGICKGAGAARSGLGIAGVGEDASYIVIMPNFNSATCNLGASGVACLGGDYDGIYLRDFTVEGTGNSQPGAGFVGKYGWEVDDRNNATLRNMNFLFWGSAQNNSNALKAGLVTNGAEINMSQVYVDGFGSAACLNTNTIGAQGVNQFTNYTCDDGGYVQLEQVATNNLLLCTSCTFSNNGNSTVNVANGAELDCVNCIIAGGNSAADGTVLYIGVTIDQAGTSSNSNGTVRCDRCGIGGSTKFHTIQLNQVGDFLYAANTAFAETSANSIPLLNNGGAILDGGGNTYSGGASGSVYAGFGSTTTFSAPSRQIGASCTGTATSSSTLGLYGTGPNQTTTTCTSTTIGSGVVMQQAGTLQVLSALDSHVGVSASSGVVTVLKNGSPTTLTCTLGTAAFCNDSATSHAVSYVQGDLISIQFTTQASEVLAGVKAQVLY